MSTILSLANEKLYTKQLKYYYSHHFPPDSAIVAFAPPSPWRNPKCSTGSYRDGPDTPIITLQRPKISANTVSPCLSYTVMILCWFKTQTFQEKLSQKSQPDGAKPAIWRSFWDNQYSLCTYLNTASTSHPTFGIIQVHFIPRVFALRSFYQRLACCNEGFSAPSIARFIA